MDKPAVRDGSLLLFRFVLGIIFVAHGFDKFFVQGLTATGQQFAAWGVPQAQLSAYLAATAEFVGGLFLTVGLLTTIVAGILALLMVAGFYLVHMNAGFFIAGGGYEYVLLLIVSLVLIVVFGSGRASIDEVLSRQG